MFVAINYISCLEEYKPRFENLFVNRAHAVDGMTGFQSMKVLKPIDNNGEYLVISQWDSEDHFKIWLKTSEFQIGHQHGFADMARAREEGKVSPMQSVFKTYVLLTE